MKQNPLFALPNDPVPAQREIPESFRVKCLYYRKGTKTSPASPTKYPDLEKFLSGSAANRIDSLWNFLEKRWKEAFTYEEEVEFVRFFFKKHLPNMIFCETVSRKSFDACAAEFKSSESYRDIAAAAKKDFYKWRMIAGTVEESCSGISFLKRLFLDDTPESDGLTATVETVFAYLPYLLRGNSSVLGWLEIRSMLDILSVFRGDAFWADLIPLLDARYQGFTGRKLVKYEAFLYTAFEKVFLSDNKMPDKRKFMEFHDALVRDGTVVRDFSHFYRIAKAVGRLFHSHDFLSMWIGNAIFFQDDSIGTSVFFNPVLYKENYPEPPIVLLDVPTGTERVSQSMDSLFSKNLRIGVADIFRVTGNLVKKEFPKNSDAVPEWLLGNMKKGFIPFANGIADTSSPENFERFAEPLGLVSKRFVSSNFSPVHFEDRLEDDFLKAWNALMAESRGKWVDLDYAYRYFHMNSHSFALVIGQIQTALLYAFDRKIQNESRVLVFSSREITKRFLTSLARFGYLEVSGNLVETEIDYMTGSGYGYSYYYEDREARVTLFDATHCRFGPIPVFSDSASAENHISGKDIFLSLKTSLEALEKMSRFAFLLRIDTHIVMEITRETLIRAKNELGFPLAEIAPIFHSLGVELPKSTVAMIASVDDTASDVVIFPVWIPVFFKQKGMFDEFTSRKMFQKHIVSSDPERLLIVFKDSFRKLESTLTERHVFFELKSAGKDWG